jgi:hypothetical protein
MTNEQAVKLILKEKPVSKAQQLAAMFACDDIIADDIEVWLGSKVSEHLMQFPDVARDLASDLIGNGATAEELRVGLCDVSESMYHYVKFHGERRMVCREILQRASCLAISTIESIEKQSLSFPCINHN